MRNYKPEVQLAKIQKDPNFLVNISNLTEEAAILAVTLDYDIFGHLPEDMKSNQNVRNALLDVFGLGIVQFSKTATDEQWHRAAVQDPTVISLIRKPQDDTVWAVLMADASLIDCIKEATDEHRSVAALLA